MPISLPARAAPLALLIAALGFVAPAGALELAAVEVQGLPDEEMRDNVDDALSLQRLNPARRRNLSESRLSYLLRQAPGEARRALEPFGYYDAQVETDVRRAGEVVTVIVQIVPGDPVRVQGRELALTGPAESDSKLMRRLQRIRPRAGQPFHHGQYEASKAAMDRALAERGYFDAEQATHKVTVNRAAHRADIALAWTSGRRYSFGTAHFEGHLFRPGLLENLVPWEPGQAWDQAELLKLQTSLSELDYFSAIDLVAETEAAVDGRVPVKVALVMGKRSVYSAGVRYGTDTGIGLTGGLERRWVNDRGHKLRALASLAQRRNDVTVQYKIPAFAWIDGWYTVSASAREDSVDDIDSELVELVGSRSGKLGDWTLVAALNLRRERFEDPSNGFEQSYSSLVFPSLWAQWGETDDPLYPRRAQGVTIELRAGSSAIGSDLDFVQMRAEARWIRGFGRRDRLLLRAEAGTTVSDDFPLFPPSLRFYAGGDRSVRGYGYREIGQVVLDDEGDRHVFGGKHLLVASAEYEHMFNRRWGGAVFVDAGDAFDDGGSFKAEIGVGVGLRWRSPVGPVRLDLAHGFGDDAQQSIHLHLNIGPDL